MGCAGDTRIHLSFQPLLSPAVRSILSSPPHSSPPLCQSPSLLGAQVVLAGGHTAGVAGGCSRVLEAGAQKPTLSELLRLL